MPQANWRYLQFRVGQQWYGIDVNDVIEVLPFMWLTELPGTTADVLGMMTLRDMVMPVLDLRLHFGQPNALLQLDSPIIAVRSAHGPLALVVDDVDDLEHVSEEQIAAQNGDDSPYVTGFARLPNHLLLLLDVSLLRAKTSSERAPAQ
ncbi:MAG: chemotaxis protein CheW [Anaerolineae bacterium]|nr:chemotaxis protein CheW [Anaerolineae bacterium]